MPYGHGTVTLQDLMAGIPFELNDASPQAAGLVGCWETLTGRGRNLFRDMCLGNNGALTSLTWAGHGTLGNVMVGTSGKARLANTLTTAGDRSMFAWIELAGLGAYSNMFTSDGAATQYPRWYVRTNNKQLMHNGTTYLDSATALAANTTYLLGWTLSGTTIAYYRNGVADGGGTLAVPTFANFCDFMKFAGSMGGARFYNYAVPAPICWQMYDPATRWQLYRPAMRFWPGFVGGAVSISPDLASLGGATGASIEGMR
jgi:hypothetical protein